MAGTFIESAWNYLEREHTWATGSIGVFVLHEVVYFGAYVPYMLCDHIPWLRQYKIQQKKQQDSASLWKCFKWLLFLHLVLEGPFIVAMHPFFKGYVASRRSEPAFPTLFSIGWQLLLFYVLEDFYFYWIHRLLHWTPLYKAIHKIHHEFHAPMGMAGEYAHPAETAMLGLGTALGPIFATLFLDMHISMIFFWIIARVLQVIDAHSGYDFPWSIQNWFPVWGGAEFHDYHHEKFNDNYSSTFIVWDNVFGTCSGYKKLRAAQKQEKLQAKLASAAPSTAKPTAKASRAKSN